MDLKIFALKNNIKFSLGSNLIKFKNLKNNNNQIIDYF
jgi:hypothetical protein